ncbi:HAMP domain-containing sensor histidine kinase [Clostridium pasteurianum]|uniref:histidine kinase n=1 Tax=Clostridium pasteurianum BC1 TaxID=86416 RepID=R4K9N9_CLOPA|nr:HAMP domain-containing sensor histidine kinase [Clostridium pasteurianum]AGK99283.1 signal transduction histidine kinase [Clostridium pasteurianum BC1]
MKKGLFSQMIATYTIIIAVSFIIVSGLLSVWFESYYFQQREDELYRGAALIKPVAINYMQGGMSYDFLNDTLQNLERYFNANILLVGKYGYVYAVSDETNVKLLDKQIILSGDIEQLRKGNIIARKDVYGDTFNMPVHTYIVPISDNSNGFEGAIMMNTSLSEIKRPLIKVYYIIWVLATFAIIIACIVIYHLSQKIIVKPLGKINYAARKIANGDIEKRVEIKSEDEIGELANSFNYMADSITKIEKNRREFISNVSHEIRSPITSIKGFIGGILDGVIPPEKEKYYLSLAYDETQRLTRLVNDLLDLSAIESGQLTLNITKLNINEIIRRTVIKFEPKINEKKLVVDVYFDKDDSYAMGDMDRIMQVVTNLIDNAIKYVVNEGKVSIGTKIKGDKIFISIYNESNPLSEDALKHIWDRFYKKDKSRTSKVSTGLGLPIVQSILTQHGEDIWVKNVKDTGVEFTFTLTKANN